MNCKEANALITDIARGQSVDDFVRETLERHVRVCPRCSLSRQQQDDLSLQLAQLRNTLEPPPSGRMEARLLEALQAETGVMKRPSAHFSAGLRIGLAAAAAVLLFVPAVYWMTRPHAESSPAASQPTAKTQLAPAPNPPAIQPTPSAEQARSSAILPAERPPARRTSAPADKPVRVATARPAPRRPEEVKGDFISLGYPTAPNEPRAVQIVRVGLRRKALAPFGFPVPPNDDETVVQADILVGEDGSAQAIRLVSEVYPEDM